jgi:hypothetical protein
MKLPVLMLIILLLSGCYVGYGHWHGGGYQDRSERYHGG